MQVQYFLPVYGHDKKRPERRPLSYFASNAAVNHQ